MKEGCLSMRTSTLSRMLLYGDLSCSTQWARLPNAYKLHCPFLWAMLPIGMGRTAHCDG